MLIFSNTKKILGFDDRWFVFHGILFVSLGMNLILFGSLLKEGLCSLFTGCYFISLVYTSLFWLFFRTIHLLVTEKYPGYENLRQRYLVLIPTVIGCFIIVKALLDYTIDPILHRFLPIGQEPHAPPNRFPYFYSYPDLKKGGFLLLPYSSRVEIFVL